MIKTVVIYGDRSDLGDYGLAHCLNGLAAEGSRLRQASVQYQVPEDRPGTYLYQQKKQWKKAVARLEASLGSRMSRTVPEGGCCPAVRIPSAIVTCEGTETAQTETDGKMEGYDLLVTGYAGMEGMLRIAEEKKEMLSGRYSGSFLHLLYGHRKDIFGMQKAETARAAGRVLVRHVGQGGIFKALWDLASETGCGLEADLRSIPVLQETIEVCELFRMNPYQLTSAGCFVLAAPDGREVLQKIRQRGENGCLIGCLTSGNDKVLYNAGEVRYLDRPAPDELWKLWKE